jgi:DNA-3-methyladenine glycosylase I
MKISERRCAGNHYIILGMQRCAWADKTPLMRDYHDLEWGTPVHEDRKLFEFLILEGAQAGLSWETILKKRDNYRAAFHDFDPNRVARYGEKEVARLLGNSGLVRNRLKIQSAISNAQQFLKIQKEWGSFDKYIWQFVDGKTIVNKFGSLVEVPGRTPASDAMSKGLLQHGFKFVGSTICYAFMQAMGMVNDHTTDCFKHNQQAS